MIPAAVKAEFEKVLKAERLADVAPVFSDPEFFDEVPLYSRYKQVEFLGHYGDVNSLLMELALEYLDRVASEVKLESKRFVAITVIRDSDEEYIVPSIFVCNRDASTRLRELRLSAPLQGFGKEVDALVKMAKPQKAFSVFEDHETVPDDVRVFVSYELPPNEFESLDSFANGIRRQRQVG
jgi:hypothetical protein